MRIKKNGLLVRWKCEEEKTLNHKKPEKNFFQEEKMSNKVPTKP
jgi:hypothetical protein